MTEMTDRMMESYRKRLETDLNRIAQSRIAERSLTENLTFRVVKVGPTQLDILPSDPVLFKKLEFGEFNPDGTLKSPAHSIIADLKAIVRL